MSTIKIVVVVVVIGTALCYSHRVCCLLYCLGKINSVSGCDCGCGLEQKFWKIDRFGEK